MPDQDGLPQPADILAAYTHALRDRYAGEQAVAVFLDQMWGSAMAIGWSDAELFGCHAQRAFAPVRYDSMGAVTLAALTGSPIVSVTPEAIRYANGTTYRRGPGFAGIPVWRLPQA